MEICGLHQLPCLSQVPLKITLPPIILFFIFFILYHHIQCSLPQQHHSFISFSVICSFLSSVTFPVFSNNIVFLANAFQIRLCSNQRTAHDARRVIHNVKKISVPVSFESSYYFWGSDVAILAMTS